MQTTDKQFRSVNICQKLFNFFVHNFLSRGLKRLTSGSPHSQNSTHIPVDVLQPNPLLANPHHNAIAQPNHAIHVHFKDGEDDDDHLQSWTRLDHGLGPLGSSVHIGETKDDINPGQVRHRVVGGTRIMVSASDGKNDTGKDKKGKNKQLGNTDKSLLGEKIPLIIDPTDETELDSLIVRPHLISVDPNINEKSDEFIRTRIAEMRDKH